MRRFLKMYMIAAVALLAVLTVFGFFSEAAPRQPNAPRQAPTGDLGSAKVLRGDTYILSCYISDSRNTWSSDEKRRINNKYHEALDWLKNQARKYNVGVNFEGGLFGFDADIKLNDIVYWSGSGLENPFDSRIVSRVLKQIGYRDGLSFYDWAKQNKKVDNSLVLIFIKGRGTSYALQYPKGGNKDLFFTEGVALYERYYGVDMELTSASIAHEILHLFGAWDLFRTYEQAQDREDKARQMFSNSIMLRVSNIINELYVDEVTAWLVGWKSDPEPWYEWFNPHTR